MSPAEMKEACETSLAAAREFGWSDDMAAVTLVTPKGWKPAPKFPRGKLLQVKEDGSRLWHFPAKRLLGWVNWAEAQA